MIRFLKKSKELPKIYYPYMGQIQSIIFFFFLNIFNYAIKIYCHFNKHVLGVEIEVKFLQPENAEVTTDATNVGIVIDVKLEQ